MQLNGRKSLQTIFLGNSDRNDKKIFNFKAIWHSKFSKFYSRTVFFSNHATHRNYLNGMPSFDLTFLISLKNHDKSSIFPLTLHSYFYQGTGVAFIGYSARSWSNNTATIPRLSRQGRGNIKISFRISLLLQLVFYRFLAVLAAVLIKNSIENTLRMYCYWGFFPCHSLSIFF